MDDRKILLLENFTYLDDVASKAGVSMSGTTVGDMLASFDENALARLENELGDKDAGAMMTGKEWAAIIREMQDPNNGIGSLKLVGHSDRVHAYCFEDSNGEAYVAFCGTTGGDEWVDNFEGLNVSDTQSQKEALDYIESLKYNDITVVGHSKGGNKAQYVAITSDKVKYCLSMDGQGFSQEFLDKYSAEIARKGGCIKNWSLSTDYVHILLFPIPNSEQKYYANDPQMANGLRNHSPGAYFWFEQDSEGKWHVRSNNNGEIYLVETAENPGLTYLHEFTCFVINVMPNDKKDRMAQYLGICLALSMDSNYRIEIDGVVYTKDKLKEYLLSDQENAALLIAYIMKYAETNNLTTSELLALIEAFVPMELLEEIRNAVVSYIEQHPVEAAALGIVGGIAGWTIVDLLQFFYKQLTDGKRDPIIEQILDWIGGWLNEKLNVTVDWKAAWINIEKEYKQIVVNDPNGSTTNSTTSVGRTLNYSNECYQLIIGVISTIDGSTSQSVSSWSSYSSEEWYSQLGISLAIKGVNGYFSHLAEINQNSRNQIDTIFERARQIDNNKAEIIMLVSDNIRTATSDLNNMSSSIGSGKTIALVAKTLYDNVIKRCVH